MSYCDLLKKEILDLLGMNNTTSSVEDYLKASNRAEWVRRLKNGKDIIGKITEKEIGQIA